jgi:hypothetical protein
MGRDNGSHRLPVQPVRGGNVLHPRISRTARYNGLKLIPWVPSMGGSLW